MVICVKLEKCDFVHRVSKNKYNLQIRVFIMLKTV